MSEPTGARSAIHTITIDGPSFVGLDPRTSEASWIAFNVEQLPQGHQRSIGTALRHLASMIWSPQVQVALVSEVHLQAQGSSTSTLAIGVHGAAGDSAVNVATIADELERVLGESVVLARRSAALILAPLEYPSVFRICQVPRILVGLEGVEVPTVWHGFPNPLLHLTSSGRGMRTEMRIRVSYLSTTPTTDEWKYIQDGAHRLSDEAFAVDRNQVDRVRGIERAMVSFGHLANRLESPLWVGEVAIASPEPLAWAQRQLLGGSMTSAAGLHWGEEGPHIIDGGPLRGGFCIAELPAELALAAHRRGLPVHGGLRPRSIHDLFSIVGLCWDVPPPSSPVEGPYQQVLFSDTTGHDPDHEHGAL